MSDNNTTLKFIPGVSTAYKINIEQRFTINGKLFVNSVTDIDWTYKVEKSFENPVVSIVTESTEVSNNPTGFDDLANFAKLFNKPTEKVELELNSLGEMKAVVNQKEIFEKWEQLADNELAEYKNDESMEGIFIAGYVDFTETIKSLEKNPLYLFFFDAIYNRNFEKTVQNKANIKLPSKLFQGTFLNLKNRQEAVNFDTKIAAKNIYRYFEEDNQDVDLADLYQRNYKDIIGPDFQYRFECNAEAEYDIDRAILNNLKAVCMERANDNLFYETKYKIELGK